jgi:hypothetical protein
MTVYFMNHKKHISVPRERSEELFLAYVPKVGLCDRMLSAYQRVCIFPLLTDECLNQSL